MPKFVSGDRVRDTISGDTGTVVRHLSVEEIGSDTHLGDSWWVVWDHCGLELYAKEQFLELV